MDISLVDMEKPNARGPSPNRKAQIALRDKLNRRSKPPPLLPEGEKSAAHAQQIIENKARYAHE